MLARRDPVATLQLRLTDPAKRLSKPTSDEALRKSNSRAAELEPAEDRRQVVARSVDAEVRCCQLIGGADAIQQTRDIDKGNGSVTASAEMEFVVFTALRQRGVETADHAKAVPPYEHGRRMH